MYELVKSESGLLRIINDEYAKDYPAGTNESLAMDLVARLNKAHRPNIEIRNDDMLVCFNLHDKHCPCEFEIEIPFVYGMKRIPNEIRDEIHKWCEDRGWMIKNPMDLAQIVYEKTIEYADKQSKQRGGMVCG